MDDAEGVRLARENAYLKLRCAQLQDDVTDLGGQVLRLHQELERLLGQRTKQAHASGGV
jgi:hypothetical protein